MILTPRAATVAGLLQHGARSQPCLDVLRLLSSLPVGACCGLCSGVPAATSTPR
jgi:hypothetical protein